MAAVVPLAIGALAVVGTFLVLFVINEFTEVSVFALNLTTAMGLGLAMVQKIAEEHGGSVRAENAEGGHLGPLVNKAQYDKVRDLIHNRAAESELQAAARANGYVPMREDGERLVAEVAGSLAAGGDRPGGASTRSAPTG